MTNDKEQGKTKRRGRPPKKPAAKEVSPKSTEPKIKPKTIEELKEILVNGSTLAKIIDISPQGVSLLARQGKIKRDADRNFALIDCVSYIITEQRKTTGNGGRPRDEGTSEADYWRAAKLREQTQEGRRQIAEEIMDAILRTWRAIGEKWLEQCRPESREDIKRLFSDFESVAGNISIDDTTTTDDDAEEDEKEEGENGETA